MHKYFLLFLITISLQIGYIAHAAPTQKAETPSAKETKLDKLWKLSDDAFHAGDYPRAIAIHEQIVALDPHDVESYSVAAWLMWSLGNGDQAQRHIERGLKANPQNWEMWDAAGQQEDLQKYFSKAQIAFQNAVKFVPAGTDTLMLRRRLAHAAENAGDLQTAETTWKKLIIDYPNDAVNANNLKRVQQKIQASKTTTARALDILLYPVKVLSALI